MTLSCILSALLFSSFNFNFILGYLACVHHTHIHTNPISPLHSPPPPPPSQPGGQKIFYNIPGCQVVGESSDLLGCICVCRLVVPFHFLCHSSLSIHSLSPPVQLITTLLPLQEQNCWKRWAIFPSISHPFFSNPVVTSNSLFLLLCPLLVEWLDFWEVSLYLVTFQLLRQSCLSFFFIFFLL